MSRPRYLLDADHLSYASNGHAAVVRAIDRLPRGTTITSVVAVGEVQPRIPRG